MKRGTASAGRSTIVVVLLAACGGQVTQTGTGGSETRTKMQDRFNGVTNG